MTRGGVSAGGRFWSSARSISARRELRKVWRSLVLRLLLCLVRCERLDARLPLRVGEDQLDFLFHFLELLIAESGEPDAFLE